MRRAVRNAASGAGLAPSRSDATAELTFVEGGTWFHHRRLYRFCFLLAAVSENQEMTAPPVATTVSRDRGDISVSRPRRALVLINDAAGSGKEAQDRSTGIKTSFARHGVDATVRPLRGPDIAEAAKGFAAQRSDEGRRGDEVLVAAGGDGTISAAAGALAGTGVPLGILPLGTLNHFAKDLGLPLDLDGATGIIAAGQTRQVDLAELNGRVFVNNSSVGLYPFMVARRTAEQRRHGVGKWLATVPAMVQTLGEASWHHLEITAPGEHEVVRTPCVFVGNNPYELGLKAFGSRRRLDGGELDVHVIRQQSRTGVLLLPVKIALGICDRERDVHVFRSATLEITSRKRRSLGVSLDGEVMHMTTPLRYRSRPGDLRVFCGPAQAPAG